MRRGKQRRQYKPHRLIVKSCGKTRYRTRADALIGLANIRRYGDDRGGKIPRRVYRCPDCHGWHLTSHGKPS